MQRFRRSLRAGFLFGAAGGLLAQGSLPSEQELTITVMVFNYAQAPSDVLSEATRYAGQIFRRVGLGIEWIDAAEVANGNAGELSGAALTLAMRIVPEPMMVGWAGHDHLTGYALVPAKGGMGRIAAANYERIEDLARRFGCRRGLLLGYVIAHELGHLLLGVNSHSATGIMAYPIEESSLLLAAQNRVHFTSPQALQIGERVRTVANGQQGTAMNSTAR